MRASLISLAYLVASVLFILCLRGLSSPEKGRRGVQLGELGMLIAVVATLVKKEILSYEWIAAGLLFGALFGTAISLKIPMTKMPERIAFSHAFGGLATSLVGISEYHKLRDMAHGAGRLALAAAPVTSSGLGVENHELSRLTMGALGFEVFLGSLTFTGSMMAFGKLQGFITGAPVTWRGQNVMNVGAFFAAIALLVYQVTYVQTSPDWMFFSMCGVGLALGVCAVLPIGGADMPVVISLLNSYAGLAACATGFALKSNILIISGALDGSSGFLLSMLMSKAMNRSFSNVVFGAFGTGDASAAGAAVTGGAAAAKPFNEATVEDAAAVLSASQSVIVVPGYGMAVSQAQHAVRDLAAALEKRGTEVKYAIHPVAGRMPGHMNVLLAEANVPYDALFDLDMINDDFARTDAVLVVGANDVVNPAAKTDTKSPIYGMPVFNVEASRSVIVLKRSMNPGFSGAENELFFLPNTMMVLGDAKKTVQSLCTELKGGAGH
jgi:NAD(P) transhydrogenase subunit beta